MKLIPFSKLRSRLKPPVVVRRVVGHSMVPVLPPGTLVVAQNIRGKIKVGDVVIITHLGKEKIKRVAELRSEEIFVTGDHADASTDSRHFGWIARNKIIAIVFWPRV